jgi:hypothetical protein
MKKETTLKKRGRKTLPESEKKIRIHIMVKRKHEGKAQKEIDKVSDKYESL